MILGSEEDNKDNIVKVLLSLQHHCGPHFQTGNIGQCNYSASKAGILGLTKTAAKELAKFGIRCNAILPGYIDTPMVGSVPEKLLNAAKSQIPLGRTGQPAEVAEACLFLASENSSYITGTTLEVAGKASPCIKCEFLRTF